MHACIYAHAHACLFCVHAGHWLEMMPSVQQLAAQSTNFFGIFFTSESHEIMPLWLSNRPAPHVYSWSTRSQQWEQRIS